MSLYKKKVYIAQKAAPSPGDFCQLVDKDHPLLDCLLTDEQIESTRLYDFKTLIEESG